MLGRITGLLYKSVVDRHGAVGVVVANVRGIDAKNFDIEILSAKEPVLLDFGADWCGPCKKMAPIVENLAGKYAGRLKVGYVDVGKDQALAAKYQVMSVPTLLFFKEGKVVRQMIGARGQDELAKAIEEILGQP